jgi:hypothetical protein
MTALLFRRVSAEGIPSAPTLYYRGTLEEAGAAVTGTRAFLVRFYTTETSGAPACTAEAGAVIVTRGAFELPLGECVATVRANANLWMELSSGTDLTSATQVGGARTRLGAVPYAIEAERASTVGGAQAAEIAALRRDLTAAVAELAVVSAANPVCPRDYTHNPAALPGTVCIRTVPLGTTMVQDEVVKVGTGATAFWVDRYEAAVHQASTGAQLAASDAVGGALPPTIASSGLEVTGHYPRDTPRSALAFSHSGRPTVSITWFHANAACRAAGKRLLRREEWFAAASGTNDGAACWTDPSNRGTRVSSPTNGCTSASGAHDMIGNVWEWTSEWYAGAGAAAQVNSALQNWPAEYNMDATWNVNGATNTGSGV